MASPFLSLQIIMYNALFPIQFISIYFVKLLILRLTNIQNPNFLSPAETNAH